MVSIIQEYVEKLELLAGKISVHYKAADIHSFRVATKKLRALLRLVSFAEQRRHLPGKLRAFYKAIGEMRILQLQEQALSKALNPENNQSLEKIISRLREELIIARKKAGALLLSGDHPFGPLAKKLTAGLPPRLNQKYREHFLAARLDVLHPAFSLQSPDAEQLHALRKAIKDLLYTWSYLGGRGRTRITRVLGGYKETRAAGKLLGDYLDRRINIQALMDAGPAEPAIVKLKKKWTEEKASIRREIDNSIGQKLNFVVRSPHPLPDFSLNPLSAENPSALSMELHLD